MTEELREATRQEEIENRVNAMTIDQAREIIKGKTKPNCENGKPCDVCLKCETIKTETPSVLHIGEIDWAEVKRLLKREPIQS